MSLHDRIMKIATHSRTDDGAGRARERGAINVKKDALEIAAEADELMAEMAEALEKCTWVDQSEAIDAQNELDTYNNWKDHTR